MPPRKSKIFTASQVPTPGKNLRFEEQASSPDSKLASSPAPLAIRSIFLLPSFLRLTTICDRFPCRDKQLQNLLTCISTGCGNIVVHGLAATGKSVITEALLTEISDQKHRTAQNGTIYQYAIIRSAECVDIRHLLERTVTAVADAVSQTQNSRGENFSQMYEEIRRLLNLWKLEDHAFKRRFIVVFDGIDQQRGTQPDLCSALARLSNIPELSSIFIVNHVLLGFLSANLVPYIEFTQYEKAELLTLLSNVEPTPQLPGGLEETASVWNKFCNSAWDALSKHSGSDLVSMKALCLDLWPRFIRPILDSTHSSTAYHKVLIANKHLFQNESVLIPKYISESKSANTSVPTIASQLPYFSKLLLVAAYLASYNKPATDQVYFMKGAAAKRRKKGGGTAKSRPGVEKHRKISRKLLGPQGFGLERMMAIFHTIFTDADGRGRYTKGRLDKNLAGSSDVQMAFATLISLRLIIKIGSVNAGDNLESSTKYRVAISWEVIRGVARSVGVEAEDYYAE